MHENTINLGIPVVKLPSDLIHRWWYNDLEFDPIWLGNNGVDNVLHRAAIPANNDSFPVRTRPLPTLGARKMRFNGILAAQAGSPTIAIDLFTGFQMGGNEGDQYFPAGPAPDYARLVKTWTWTYNATEFSTSNLLTVETDPATDGLLLDGWYLRLRPSAEVYFTMECVEAYR